MTDPDRDRLDELARKMAAASDPLEALGDGASSQDPSAAEVEALLQSLERVGADERQTLAEAAAWENAAGEELVANTLADLAAKSAAGPGREAAPHREADTPSPIPIRYRMLAAAAMLIVSFGMLYFLRPDEDGPPQLLGGQDLELVAPLGTVATYGAFAWSAEAGEGGWFEVKLYADDGGFAGDEFLSSGRLDSSPWQLTPEQVNELPTSLFWEVLVRDTGGSRTASRQGHAQREP